jgi:1,4-dihydroxy-6-naphthoate synthase
MTTLHAPPAAASIAAPKPLAIAYTPDSDDVFNFYAWEQGRVSLPGFAPRFDRSHIDVLNRAAAAGLYDVVAVSSVVYPSIAHRYWILAVGSSVGRGYGPVLVSKRDVAIEALAGRRVAVAGLLTTGGALARMYCPPGTELVVRPYNLIADAILRGEVDAGVMIHEELVHFPALGLRRVCDLGGAWLAETGLPLPVGLNLVRRSLGRETARAIARACRGSLLWALDHDEEALAFARRFGRGQATSFIPMFSNDDTLRMPDDVRRGMRVLFDRIAALGIAPRIEECEVIDD